MNVFDYENCRDWLRDWISSQPKKGRGLIQQLARNLRISTVLMSQILSGARALQPEHAIGLTKAMGLTPRETDFFLLLAQVAQAGSEDYREYLRQKLDSIRDGARDLKNRVRSEVNLSEHAKAIFYSNWLYSAIRLLTDIPETQTPQAIADKLGVSVSMVSEILDFLVAEKLCSSEGGRFQMEVKNTHLAASSAWAYPRQIQWRHNAIHKMNLHNRRNLFYTGPMVLASADRDWVRERLIQVIHEITEKARASTSQELACLNIDWFSVL